ncbi:nuclease-related domain-containing protein [Zobellia galactanivorans]|uniref:nuclease-related domain-containing protein n=1 Tax=Zobellia galactanivorans (strain DSM 12802 / CCUG 47099 / CIP 106680 / NCIMB 13871 / Dsij) TaxID=63186 RepID=UPI001C068E67|nr:nuclease-related domain-containing protein [Zobellia galactanivorans]MBU3027582.1 NERD domain-containing protein [Zobellia galactanivorans]
MARIYGTIESLKSLKSELEDKGISRFSSVKEIKDFLANYKSEKQSILDDTSAQLDAEYFKTCKSLELKLKKKTEIINFQEETVKNKTNEIQRKIDSIQNKNGENFLQKILSSINLYFLKKHSNRYLKKTTELANSSLNNISRSIEKDEVFIKAYETEKTSLIEKRAKPKTEKLEYTLSVIENSRNLISGAIGENLVVKEIKKLSDDYVLINDFNLNFSRPIFYKKHNQRIYSIQIDHLLISKAGIFIIETKNWSKSSVESMSLRSPIEQIERANFALYIYISENITLNGHHWGEQQVPIRNLIVMINNKPKGEFKYVKVKLLNEMNDYIKYFEPVLTENQVNRITDILN